jgi:hypothetical protein
MPIDTPPSGRHRALRRTRLAALVVLALAVGCAPRPGDLEPLPRHPFPRWVEKLEIGKSDRDSVRGRFGDPDSVEQSVRGGLVYRYRFAEIMWPDADPDRPVVAANGEVVPRSNTKLQDLGDSVAEVGSWLDWLMFYPPKQPRPIGPRWLPATIHELEVSFDLEGRLVRYRYTPQVGRAPLRRRG